MAVTAAGVVIWEAPPVTLTAAYEHPLWGEVPQDLTPEERIRWAAARTRQQSRRPGPFRILPGSMPTLEDGTPDMSAVPYQVTGRLDSENARIALGDRNLAVGCDPDRCRSPFGAHAEGCWPPEGVGYHCMRCGEPYESRTRPTCECAGDPPVERSGPDWAAYANRVIRYRTFPTPASRPWGGL